MDNTYIDDAFAAQARCPAGKQKVGYRDAQSGLLLEVSPSGRKTFAVSYNRDGALLWHEIGSYPNVPTELARGEAYRLAWAADREIFEPFEKPAQDRTLTPTQRADTLWPALPLLVVPTF
jgi:hypothetical protein